MSEAEYRCHCECVHSERVEAVLAVTPAEEKLFELATLFRVLGDATRVRILWALSVSELCVCDLAAALSMDSSAVSHQLRLLRSAKLVRHRREGKMAYYSLCDAHVEQLFSQGFEHISE